MDLSLKLYSFCHIFLDTSDGRRAMVRLVKERRRRTAQLEYVPRATRPFQAVVTVHGKHNAAILGVSHLGSFANKHFGLNSFPTTLYLLSGIHTIRVYLEFSI